MPTDFRKAAEIVVPVVQVLDSLLSEQRYLDHRLGQVEEAKAMVLKVGAKPFTVNSLIRLRCADQEQKNLKTKLDPKEEANYHFTDYEEELWPEVGDGVTG
jgi:hypothetical protein